MEVLRAGAFRRGGELGYGGPDGVFGLTGDLATISSLLGSYSSGKPRAGTSEPCSIVEVGGTSTPLHLAVRCAKCELDLDHSEGVR